jgi:rhodanese-related sulfurtransferase
VNEMRELDVATFGEWREQHTPHVLLDVREAAELQAASLDGATWIPMGQLIERIDELPSGVPIVVMCHHGTRSTMVAEYLAGSGRPDVYNLTGGIESYAQRVDPSIARY